MKLFQWIIFISILSAIFLVIYRQCHEKGFRRVWVAFKTAVVISATLAGLLPENVKAQEFDHFQYNNQQVTLVGRDSGGTPQNVPYNPGKTGQSPANFPISPAQGRPTPSTPTYRGVPKVVSGPGGGGGANPGGGGNGAVGSEFDGQCPVPKEKESKKSTNTDDGSISKKSKEKQSVEECELDENVKERKIEIVYRIKENPALVREAKRMGKDQAAQKDVNHLIEQLSLGNSSPGIGTVRLKGLKNVSESRGRNEGRVYYRKQGEKIEILGKSNKDNQETVIAILKKIGY